MLLAFSLQSLGCPFIRHTVACSRVWVLVFMATLGLMRQAISVFSFLLLGAVPHFHITVCSVPPIAACRGSPFHFAPSTTPDHTTFALPRLQTVLVSTYAILATPFFIVIGIFGLYSAYHCRAYGLLCNLAGYHGCWYCHCLGQ